MNIELTINCSQYGSEAKRKKVDLQARLLVRLAKLVLLVGPAPTSSIDKHSGAIYHCPNCGHKWTKNM